MKLDKEKLEEVFDIEAELAKPPVKSEDEEAAMTMSEVPADFSSSDKVYDELGKLVVKGKSILDTLAQNVHDGTANGQMIVGTATMLNSVKDTIKEFTKIHMAHLNQIHAVEMEKLKQKHRVELAAMRNIAGGEKNVTAPEGQTTQLVPFCQERIIDEIYKAEAGLK